MGTRLSRRRFCGFVIFGPLIAMGNPPATDEPSAPLLYTQGLRMLSEGRTFEKAIAHFSRAAESEPQNPDYQIALGCALASRAASLAWTGAFAERLKRKRAAYPKLMQWFTEQEAKSRQELKDKNASAAEVETFEADVAKVKEKLKLPVSDVIHAKDDKTPYRLTQAELSARLTALNREALSSWEKGARSVKLPRKKRMPSTFVDGECACSGSTATTKASGGRPYCTRCTLKAKTLPHRLL